MNYQQLLQLLHYIAYTRVSPTLNTHIPAHRVTKERAATLPIGSVMKLVLQKYTEKEGDLLQALYSRVKG